MPVDFEFKLDTSSKKFECPNCGKKSFVRYRNHEGEFAPDEFGRCDREINCGYLLIPDGDKVIVERKIQVQRELMFIDFEDALSTSVKFEENNLIKFFIDNLGVDAAEDIVQRYRIGIDQTLPSTTNWIIWWQFDNQDRCRSGKLMKYLADGHRDKNHSSTWYHKLNPKYQDFIVTQCYFGEHLLDQFPSKKVAIVESEKTACIASYFMPEYIWLASGSVGGLGFEKSKVLQNRSVTLFPDLGAFDKWNEKAKDYGWNISRVLEDAATEEQRALGLDLADFLI